MSAEELVAYLAPAQTAADQARIEGLSEALGAMKFVGFHPVKISLDFKLLRPQHVDYQLTAVDFDDAKLEVDAYLSPFNRVTAWRTAPDPSYAWSALYADEELPPDDVNQVGNIDAFIMSVTGKADPEWFWEFGDNYSQFWRGGIFEDQGAWFSRDHSTYLDSPLVATNPEDAKAEAILAWEGAGYKVVSGWRDEPDSSTFDLWFVA